MSGMPSEDDSQGCAYSCLYCMQKATSSSRETDLAGVEHVDRPDLSSHSSDCSSPRDCSTGPPAHPHIKFAASGHSEQACNVDGTQDVKVMDYTFFAHWENAFECSLKSGLSGVNSSTQCFQAEYQLNNVS